MSQIARAAEQSLSKGLTAFPGDSLVLDDSYNAIQRKTLFVTIPDPGFPVLHINRPIAGLPMLKLRKAMPAHDETHEDLLMLR